MTSAQLTEMMNAAANSECVEVNIIACNAGDSAADTVGWNHSRFTSNGDWSDAYIAAYVDAVVSALSYPEGRTQGAIDFFKGYGIVA